MNEQMNSCLDELMCFGLIDRSMDRWIVGWVDA